MSKTKIIANDIRRNLSTQKFIFRILLSSLFAIFIVYIYIIGSITFNIVARKSLENTSKMLNSNISNLELTYLTNMNDINITKATSLGYVEARSNIFALRAINHVAIR